MALVHRDQDKPKIEPVEPPEPGPDFVSLEELMRQQGITGPQGLQFWLDSPYAGDDEEVKAWRRVIEEHCW
jgi:hypothetical protein